MKVKDIKYWLKYYRELKTAVVDGCDEVQVAGYRKLYKWELDYDLRTLCNLIDYVKEDIKDGEIQRLFEMKYEKRFTDKKIICELYMSKSTYYREKEKIYIKLITLCAMKGLLTDINEVSHIFR